MRTLKKNQVKLWYVNPSVITDEIDSDGNYTGEKIKTYSAPVVIYINIYPANGSVVEEIFGKDVSLDMIATSNEVILDKDTLLFLSQPINEYYETNYDYRIDRINKSLNTYQYGLRNRT